MKLLFISNFMNHHQAPISNEFYKLLGDDFKFIACEKVPEDKVTLGYRKDFNMPFLVDGTTKETVYKHLEEADVLIAGSCPREYMNYFINNKKLIFIYSERLFKDGTWHKYSPLARYNMHKFYNKNFNENMYLLCSSAYTASDYHDFGSFKNHYLKWGYFPELSKLSFEELNNKKIKNSIIWVGRLIDWKHPEQSINLAKFLKDNNIDFKLSIIGDGPLKNKMEESIIQYNLQENVNLLGSLPFKEVRNKMEESTIFIFTSDFNEGWGAVLNEAMSSACACVASYKAGSTIYLLDNDNGTIYDNTQNDLNKKVLNYLNNNELTHKHAKQAFNTINTLWNYKLATKNLVSVSKDILDKKLPALPKEGPVSKAAIITNKAAYTYVKKESDM